MEDHSMDATGVHDPDLTQQPAPPPPPPHENDPMFVGDEDDHDEDDHEQEPEPALPRPPPRINRAAQKVMTTPELILHILSHVDPRWFPDVGQINRVWNMIVHEWSIPFGFSNRILRHRFESQPRVIHILTAYVLQYPPSTYETDPATGEGKAGREHYQFVFSCQAGRSRSIDSNGTTGSSSGGQQVSSGSGGSADAGSNGGNGGNGDGGNGPGSSSSSSQTSNQQHIHFHGENLSGGCHGSQHSHLYLHHHHHHRSHEPSHENALEQPSLQALGHAFQSTAIIPNIYMRSAVQLSEEQVSPLPAPQPFITAPTPPLPIQEGVPLPPPQSPSLISTEQLHLQESLILQASSFSSTSTSSSSYPSYPYSLTPLVRVVPCPYDYSSESSSMSYEDTNSFLSSTSPLMGPGGFSRRRQETVSSVNTTGTTGSGSGSSGGSRDSGESSGSGSFSETQHEMTAVMSTTSVGTVSSSSSSVVTAVPMHPTAPGQPLHPHAQRTVTTTSGSTTTSNPSRHWNVSMQSFYFKQAALNAMIRAANHLLQSPEGRGCAVLERHTGSRIIWNEERRVEYIWTVTSSLMDRTNPDYVERDYDPEEDEDEFRSSE